MKRFFVCILVVLMLCCSSLPVLANDFPESLLRDDWAQIFFAQVVEYDADAEPPYIRMIPVKIIKGDVALGEEIRCNDTNPYGDFTIGDFRIREGKAYLVTLLSPTDTPRIMRCDSYDTCSLDVIDLKDRQGGIERIERYLTSGQYEEAETKRRQELGLEPQVMQIDGELPPLHTLKDEYMLIFNWLIGAAGIIVLAIPIACVIERRKRIKLNY